MIPPRGKSLMTNEERFGFVPEKASPYAGDERREPRGGDLEALMKAIRVIAQAIDTRSKAVSRASGLTIPQIVVMQAVHDHGEVTTNLLSRHCDLTAATVVSILDKLEERGFVARYRNAADRRIVHTKLTPAGLVALGDAPPLLPPSAIAGLALLPENERAALVSAFRRVAELLREPERR